MQSHDDNDDDDGKDEDDEEDEDQLGWNRGMVPSEARS